ncbi:MAG TPA: hypothetical protein PLP66_11570 [Phycisphaerae bacterium]|nr:hypothetical protein [Phycisphaerae bacterium]
MSRMALVAAVLLGGICGCVPEKRVAWSPDGHWATVKAADGLYLCDESGKLSARLVEGVNSVAWLPDSKHLLWSRTEPVTTWEALLPLLTPEQRKTIETRGPRLREELMAHQGDWDGFEPESIHGLTDGETPALLIYVRDKLGDGLPEKLGDKWNELKELTANANILDLVPLNDAGTPGAARVIVRSINAYEDLCVSPSGKLVAYRSAAASGSQPPALFVVALDGGTPQLVADHAAAYPDWSADSRYIVYAATNTPGDDDDKNLRLGVVARRQVCGAGGTLLAELPDPEELAGIVFQNWVRVRCLRDGRVLFATLEVHMPCVSADMPQRAGLFAVDPGRQPGVTRLTSRAAENELPGLLLLFEVSPDERHLAVPGDDGRTAILTLATGAVWPVVGEGECDRLRTVPAWRSRDELCCAVVPGSNGEQQRAEIALLKLDFDARQVERRIISTGWPGEIVVDFLQDKSFPPQSQPANP